MRKLNSVLVLVLALSPMTMASDIAFYVGPWNPGWYDARQFEHVDTVIEQTGHLFKDIQQFDATQLDALGAWVDENTDDGEMDIIWLNGTIPSTLFPFPNLEPDGSRAENWLDGGNMIINVGDWFGYVSYEGGTRETANGPSGAGNILDLPNGIIASAGGTQLTVTPTGKEYMPSIGDTVETDRPVVLSNVQPPWEVAAAFASTGGSDSPAEAQADPVVIHNTETGGYVAIINQDSGSAWLPDRGLASAEFIGNWVKNVVGLGDPALAGDPAPEDALVDVARDVVLSWAPGDFAVTHDVYIGTSFDDVNNATTATSAGQSETTYDAGRLDFSQTYYWRVDEVNGAPDFTVYKGEVWSFEVEPIAIPIPGVTASASSSFGLSSAEKAVDGSGLVDDLHGVSAADMWISGGVPASIEFAFDRAYKLHEAWIWNSNQLIEAFVGFGAKDVVIEHSLDGENWTVLDGVGPLAQATGSDGYAHNNTIDFGGATARQVRITVNSVQGIAPQASLSEVRFYYIPTFATRPSPEDGATGVAPDTTLSWGRDGREAASHDVYLGSDAGDLTLAGTVDESSLSTGALDLGLGQTYAWRVDEVNAAMDPSTWTGDVWSFSTVGALVIDDMERYADEEFLEIWATWVDGFEDPANGSLVGTGPAGTPETSIVQGGRQSLPMEYDNSAAVQSEATRTFDAPMDWSRHGVQSLSLYFRGDSGNTSGQLYVKINDTKVSYNGDASDLGRPIWLAWNIDLSSVAGGVSNVRSLTVGVEGAGATGVVYIDSIALYAMAPEFIVPTEPDVANLVARYTFDGNANDSSGNGHHGTPVGAITFVNDAERGQVVGLPGGDDQYISIEGVGISGTMPRTIACWAKADNTAIPNWTLIFGFTGTAAGGGGGGSHFNIGSLGGPGGVGAHVWGWEETIFSDEDALEWHHYAMSYDGTTIRYYGDGVAMDTDVGKSNVRDLSTSSDRVHVGSRITQTSSFPGNVDDAVIYSVTLSDEEVAWLAGRTAPLHKGF